jgi:soluble lytic murein transglycosylase-like protein
MNVKYHTIMAALFLVGPGAVFATGPVESCFEQAEAKYGISQKLLKAIAHVESSKNPAAVNLNYRTYDIGLMQINSAWMPTIAQYGIEARDLYDACTNIDVGAWILSREIARHGYTWRAVGYYHSPTPKLQEHYIRIVADALEKK